jgi:hypothetical protein
LQKSLQQEWQFVQRITKGIGPEFASIEQTLAKTFLPTLFGDEYDGDDPRRALAGLPVKWARLAIPDPTTSAQPHYEASILLCSHILAAFRGVDAFRLTYHLKVIRDVKVELKLRNAAKSESSLNDLALKISCNVGGQICDICLSVTHSKLLIIFRKFQNVFPLVNSICQKATVLLLLSSRMHNLKLALREVSTAAYSEQKTHLQ